jgi:hypothetical protein
LNAKPHGADSELLVTVIVGVGLPVDANWPGANATIGEAPATFESHMLPLASNAMAPGSSIELPLVVRVTAGTGVPDAVSWLGENLTTLYGGWFPFATQIPPAASIAIPTGLLSEFNPSSPIVIAGVGAPVACSWLGVYSISFGSWTTHISPAASKAIPMGPLNDPLAGTATLMTTAGAGLPLEANWLAVNSTTSVSARLDGVRLELRDPEVPVRVESDAGKVRRANADRGRGGDRRTRGELRGG